MTLRGKYVSDLMRIIWNIGKQMTCKPTVSDRCCECFICASESIFHWETYTITREECLHAHTHTTSFPISAGAVMGPLFSLPSYPQLSSPSFVPRLHTVMSRSCLWGVQPGRRLVFRALLFFPFLFLSFLLPRFFCLYRCWLITGAFSSCQQRAAAVERLPVSHHLLCPHSSVSHLDWVEGGDRGEGLGTDVY